MITGINNLGMGMILKYMGRTTLPPKRVCKKIIIIKPSKTYDNSDKTLFETKREACLKI